MKSISGNNIKYNEETDMIQIYFNNEWVDWKCANLLWDGVIYDVNTGINLIPSDFETTGDVNYVRSNPNSIHFHASGAGGASVKAHSLESFTVSKKYSKLRWEATSTTSNTNVGAYFTVGVADIESPYTDIRTSSKVYLNSSSKSSNGYIELDGCEIDAAVLVIKMQGNSAHYSNIDITKIWLE